MNEGAIVEHGDHNLLMSTGGYYSDMMGKFHANDTSKPGLFIFKKVPNGFNAS